MRSIDKAKTADALHIRFFGTPSFTFQERPVSLVGPPKAMPLLAYVLLHRDAPITREKLAFSLWPDTSETDARANVRRHLLYVQRFLGDIDKGFRLQTDASAVRWNPKLEVRFDVADFERLAAQPQTVAEATALYSGDLLADYYDDWIFAHRERLRTRYLQILDDMIRKERSLRNYSQALRYVQLVLARDPWREDAVRQLMTLRYALGDRSGALAQYEAFAERLREDVGAAPMSDTSAIYDAILRNAAVGIDEEYADAEVKRKDGPVLPFIGRGSVVEVLNTRWERAARGHGSAVLISGEPGIGKTRCARELAILTESQGARVLIGTTSYPESDPYQPLTEALRLALPMLSNLEVDPVWLSAASTLIPEVRAREPSIQAPPPLEGSKEQTRLFEAMAQLLESIARSRPLLLILEDLHWAGAATIAALEFIVRRAPQMSLMIVATYREDEVGRTHQLRAFRRRLEREALTTQIPLGRLPLSAVRELVEKFDFGQTEDFAQRFFAQSEGNPFFLTEAIRDYQTSPGDSDQTLHGRAQDLIEKRIRALSEPAIALAESAAVIGASFDLELLRELCGWSENDIFYGLDELIGRFIVREASQPHVDYSFSHHLFQRAVYDRIPQERRRGSHRRIARALLELYPDRADDFATQIALHLERAGDREESAAYYFKAAQRAQVYFGNEEALDLIARALDSGPADSQRFDFLSLREELCSRIGDRRMQEAALTDLRALVPPEDLRMREVLHRHAVYFHVTGQRAAERNAIASLKTRCETVADREWLARVTLLEAQHLESVGDLQTAITLTEEVLAHYATSDSPGLAQTMCLLGELYSTRGRYAEAQTLFRRVLQRDDIERNLILRIRALRATARSAIEQRDFELARSIVDELLILCRKSGDREGEADAHARLGAVCARGGNVESAEGHYAAASRLYGSLNKPQGEAAVFTNRGLLLFLVGQCQKALRSYAQAQALFENLGDLRGKTVCALNSSQCYLYLNRFEDSKRHAVDSLAFARALTSPSLEATALANIGAAERELRNYARAIEAMRAGVLIRRGLDEPADLASDLCDLALAYLAAGELASAVEAHSELLEFERAHRAGALFPQYFPWVCACVSRAAGDSGTAATFLKEAHMELQARVAQIDYAPYRQSYRRLPFNLQISAASKDDRWTDSGRSSR